MTQQSKFTGALANLTPRPTGQSSEGQKPPSTAVVITPELITSERGKGRPPGKRSNPDFQPTTVLLRTQTKKKANRLLEDGEQKKDLSDLIEELLSHWIHEHS